MTAVALTVAGEFAGGPVTRVAPRDPTHLLARFGYSVVLDGGTGPVLQTMLGTVATVAGAVIPLTA